MRPLGEHPNIDLFSLPSTRGRKVSSSNNWNEIVSKLAVISLCLATLAVIIYANAESSIAIFLSYLTFGLLGSSLVWKTGVIPMRIFVAVYTCAAIACVVLAVVFTYYYGVPYWKGGSDELHYEQFGTQFGRTFGIFDYGVIRGGIVNDWHNSVGYIYLMGLLVKFGDLTGGFHTLVPRLFNACALGLLSVVLYHVGIRLKLAQSTAVISSLGAGFLPLMMWVSAQSLRDTFQALILCTLVYLWLPDSKKNLKYSIGFTLLLSFILIIPVWEIRKMQAFVIFLIIGSSVLLNKRSYNIIRLLFVTIPIASIAGLFIIRHYSDLSSNVLGAIEQTTGYTDMRTYSDVGGGLSSFVFSSPLFPIGWILRSAYALVSPIPVDYSTVYTSWLSLGTIFHIFFLTFLWGGIRGSIHDPGWRLIILAFLLFFAGMAMFTFTIRHMVQFLPFAVLLSAHGYEKYRGDPREIWFVTGASCGALAFLYLLLKVI